jgi:hypothetical protein
MYATTSPRSFAIALTALTSLAACSSTAAVPASALKHAGRGREATLRAFDRSAARLGPSTQVRFLLADGGHTPWFSAASLWTNDRGVFALRPGAAPSTDDAFDGLAWSQIREAEVKNFEGGQTVIVVAAVAVLVVAVVASLTGKSSSAPFPHTADTALRVASAASSLSRSNGGAAAVDPPADSPADSPDDPPDDPPEIVAPNGTPPAPPGAAPAEFEAPSPEGARPLFARDARRRASIKGLLGLEATVPATYAGGVQPGAFAGVRVVDFLELGGGARRTVSPRGPAQDVAFARLGLHGELDARRRFALPLSVDVGAGPNVEVYVRVNWGLRFRVYDELSIGAHPFSPVMLQRTAGTPGGPLWSASSGLDLSWGF